MKSMGRDRTYRIDITHITCLSLTLPDVFNGFTILHVSDLHNCMFGDEQSLLIQYTKEIAPDIIVITGDLIDRRRININAAMAYVSAAAYIAPVYYVAGNHEMKCGAYDVLSQRLRNCGVHVLDNRRDMIVRGGAKIAVAGVLDPTFVSDTVYNETIGKLTQGISAEYKILLAHRPDMHVFSMHDIDLVFCGHAHGGQFRLPLVGGLYAPGQGIFPKYTSGLHTENGTSMVVSRGLGNSLFPFRLFNRPELIVVTLKRQHGTDQPRSIV
jgi:predicted MPP superfamily phosphohydrolase